jgi:hypothetical protein
MPSWAAGMLLSAPDDAPNDAPDDGPEEGGPGDGPGSGSGPAPVRQLDPNAVESVGGGPAAGPKLVTLLKPLNYSSSSGTGARPREAEADGTPSANCEEEEGKGKKRSGTGRGAGPQQFDLSFLNERQGVYESAIRKLLDVAGIEDLDRLLVKYWRWHRSNRDTWPLEVLREQWVQLGRQWPRTQLARFFAAIYITGKDADRPNVKFFAKVLKSFGPDRRQHPQLRKVNPSQGSPSQGSPSQGSPSQGSPSQGSPSQGEVSQGDSAPIDLDALLIELDERAASAEARRSEERAQARQAMRGRIGPGQGSPPRRC